jgi:hypothetical protein
MITQKRHAGMRACHAKAFARRADPSMAASERELREMSRVR